MTREVADRIAAGLEAAWERRVGHLEGHLLRPVDGVVVCLSNPPDPEQNVALVEIEHGRHPSVDRAVRALGLAVAERLLGPSLLTAEGLRPYLATLDGRGRRRGPVERARERGG